MTTTDIQPPSLQPEPTSSPGLSKSTSSNESSGGKPPSPSTDDKKEHETTPRPLRIYTRSQLLKLYESPLVKLPDGMPALKDWFGTDIEQNQGKKEPEPSTSNATRDRRFRHGGTEEGDAPPRASFRSSLSQPSQMGNFKHQSIRSTDRERDRGDTDRDRERDLRDKEGQERLRHLSDKYDRERMALPANMSGVRGKDRDAPSNLPNGSGRNGSQSQVAAGAGRQADMRNPPKKKVGEATDDWRRVGDPPRGRDDRAENGRKDREDRDRPRSRGGENNGRNKRDPSPRRERDDRRDRDDRKGPRRDKDADRDNEHDDPRRWRDDGKRDERMAARNDREREERDTRGKRGGGRERRPDADDIREKEDRREREREKEPAWMDTYVPNSSGGGILGGKGADGELDGIQAFKKGMKEKEQKEKGVEVENSESRDSSLNIPAVKSDGGEKVMDEIQMFRMMMKREEDKKKGSDKLDVGLGDEAPLASSTPNNDPAVPRLLHLKEQKDPAPVNGESHTFDPTHSSQTHNLTANGALKPVAEATNAIPSGPSALLSLLTNPDQSSSQSTSNNSSSPAPTNKPPTSRLFPRPLGGEQHSPGVDNEKLSPSELSPPSVSSPFNPPSGSRLLALGSRNTSNPATKQSLPFDGLNSATQTLNGLSLTQQLGIGHQNTQQPTFQQPPGLQLGSETSLKPVSKVIDNGRPLQFGEEQPRFAQGSREAFIQTPEGVRRPSGGALGQTSAYFDQGFANSGNPSSLSQASPTGADTLGGINGSGSMTAKGSRFAKFFDGKARDGMPGMVKGPSPGLSQGQEQGGFGGDARTMDDIFAMLSNSTQGHRSVSLSQTNAGQIPANHQFAHQSAHSLQHQLHSQQIPQQAASRHESLYDSRLDDRSFVPDGMVPGLRTNIVPQRNRDPLGGMFSDPMDDHGMQFNSQQQQHRLAQQQRGLEAMFSSGGPVPSHFGGQQVGVGGRGIVAQQPQFRGGPSPIPNQNALQQGPLQQRLPPGLANLGGRPPHEPSQFMNMAGLNSVGGHGPLLGNGMQQQQQQSFNNNFAGGAGLGFGGPQIRGPPPAPHQLQGPLGHSPLGGMGHGSMDLRGAANQAQLLALTNGLRSGGGGPGNFSPQNAAQMQLPLHSLRHQQQQQPLQQQAHHLPPHMMPHLLPPHLQQAPAPNNQPAHDLMALLMGGSHNRE